MKYYGLCRHIFVSIRLNQTCLNEKMLPKYTYIYIYIYIEREREREMGFYKCFSLKGIEGGTAFFLF